MVTPVGTTTTTSTGVAVPVSAPAPKLSVPAKKLTGAFDSTTFTTTSTNPRITGTANTKEVQVVVINAAGVGIVGGMQVPVTNGHWEFISSLKLAPGTYELQLGGVDPIMTATLVLTAP